MEDFSIFYFYEIYASLKFVGRELIVRCTGGCGLADISLLDRAAVALEVWQPLARVVMFRHVRKQQRILPKISFF